MSLKAWLGFCSHQWKMVRQGIVTKTYRGDYLSKTHWSIHQCTKCGKLKKEQVNT